MRITALALLSLSLSLGSASAAQSPRWPQFGGNGHNVRLEAQRLPDRFGPKKNVLWRTAMLPGRSSPCIWGAKMLLTAFDDEHFLVLCIDRMTGAELWRARYPREQIEEFDHPASSPAAPTCACDGERLVAYFGAYGLVALDLDGEKLWEKRFEYQPATFGHGSSPVLHAGAVYLQRDMRKGSALHCLDAKTGEERWVTPRPEASENFGTPIVLGSELLVAGTSVLKAYDLRTGEAKWWVQGLTTIVCPSPVASRDTIYFGGWSTPNVQPNERLATGFDVGERIRPEDLESVAKLFSKLDLDGDGHVAPAEIPAGRAKDAFGLFDFNKNGTWEARELQGLISFPTAPGKNVLVAVKPGGAGDVTETHVLWSKRRGIPYVSTPLLYKGRLYYFKKGGFASCVDAATGKAFYESKRLGVSGEYYANAIGAGERVYIASERGSILTLGTGDSLEVLAKNDFGEAIVGSPAVMENTLYVRTLSALYAIGERAGATEDEKRGK